MSGPYQVSHNVVDFLDGLLLESRKGQNDILLTSGMKQGVTRRDHSESESERYNFLTERSC